MNPLKILVIDDEQLIRWSFEKQLNDHGYKIFSAETGEEGIRIVEMHFPDIVFVDNQLPGIQGLEVIPRIKTLNEDTIIVFMTAYGSINTAVKAMKLGASEYVSKPFTFKEIHAILVNLKQKINITNEVKLLRRQHRDVITFDQIVGDSTIIKKIIQEAKKIARIDSTTILLLGESGTGKDFFARAIHNDSPRKDKPFVTINCSSLPETLLESELFGHEQGAFTDAKKLKKGLFEMAEGGTVFLDEIGEINQATQVKLLGVLENRIIKRVGGTASIPVDIRIIAATNKDLKKSIEDKTFREDLYYRLKVFQITIPPLRDHKDDVFVLTDHFLKLFNVQFGKNIRKINHDSKEILENYNWPGNIRELRNVIERAVILETSELLQKENLPSELIYPYISKSGFLAVEHTKTTLEGDVLTEGSSLYDMEKLAILQTLDKTNHNQSKAARLLGISRDTLRYRIKKYNL